MTEATEAADRWDEELLKPGNRVFFKPLHPRYGRAEFEFCHVFKRGKLQSVFVYPRQQEVPSIYYRIECHRRAEFCIGSCPHKGLDEPKVWMQFWCKEHGGFVLRVYVPPQANNFRVGDGDVYFDSVEATA